VYDDAFAEYVGPERCRPAQPACNIGFIDLDHLDRISREPPGRSVPPLYGKRPGFVVLIDVSRTHEHDVHVAQRIGFTACKRTEDDRAHRSRVHLAGQGAELLEHCLAGSTEGTHQTPSHVVLDEREKG